MTSSSHADHAGGTHSHLYLLSGVGVPLPPTLSTESVSMTPPSTPLAHASPLPPSTPPITLPTPLRTSPPHDLPSSASLLVAAAARVDARRVTYGPLWGVRCSTKDRPKTELQVYDVFYMIFLDPPGVYYRVD
jgi:hypothetical protein